MAVSLDYYADGQRHSYELPQRTIPPRASELVDVGAIIASAQPDGDGDVIPGGVSVGGYRVQKVGPRLDKVVMTEALVFDRQRKSFLSLYNTCCAFTRIRVDPTQIVDVVGFQQQLLVEGRDACLLGWVDATRSAFYASADPQVATVGATSGLVGGAGVGNTTVTSELDFFKPLSIDASICIAATLAAFTDTDVLEVSQSPSLLNMSTGDTKEITVTVNPSTATVNTTFATSVTSNPDSSCAASLSVPGKTGQGNILHDVTASPAGCSGVFSTRASADGVQSSNTTTIRIPPQVLIQMMRGEAGLQSDPADASQPAIGVTARNRINNPDFPGSTNYQNTITSQDFDGIDTSVTTGVTPELNHALGVFTREIGDIVESAGCF